MRWKWWGRGGGGCKSFLLSLPLKFWQVWGKMSTDHDHQNNT